MNLRPLHGKAALLAAAVLLHACAMDVYPGSLARTLASRRPLDVPLQTQRTETECGIAAAQMVSAYYQRPFPEAQLASLHERARGVGVTGQDLKDAFEGAGYFAAIFAGTLDDPVSGLKRHLDAGRPLIVLVGGEGQRHYWVVAGYDDDAGIVFINDPAGVRLGVKYARFDEAWARAGRMTVVAAPAG